MPLIPEPPTAEILAMRRITDAFLKQASAQTIVLSPRSRRQKPSGGWTWEFEEDRLPQQLKLIEADTPGPANNVEGVSRQQEFMLLGGHDALIGIGDVFSYENEWYEVIEMYPYNRWEVRAKCTRYSGGAPHA